MSREYYLVTRGRPTSRAFLRALAEVAGHAVDVDGDFEDPDDYLNISSHDLLLEVEPPGHVDAVDLAQDVGDGTTLPEPDAEGCLWFAVAAVPAGAPEISADIVHETFRRLALDFDGVAVDPQAGVAVDPQAGVAVDPPAAAVDPQAAADDPQAAADE